MKIFNIVLNGEDAKEFCKQSTEFKVNWIKTHTTQQNTAIIMDFINNPPKDDCGCGCGEKKEVREIKKIIPEIKPEEPVENTPEESFDLNAEPPNEETSNFSKQRRFRRE